MPMSNSKRLTIVHTAEINDLYGVPRLSLEERRVSFALNDLEQATHVQRCTEYRVSLRDSLD